MRRGVLIKKWKKSSESVSVGHCLFRNAICLHLTIFYFKVKADSAKVIETDTCTNDHFKVHRDTEYGNTAPGPVQCKKCLDASKTFHVTSLTGGKSMLVGSVSDFMRPSRLACRICFAGIKGVCSETEIPTQKLPSFSEG